MKVIYSYVEHLNALGYDARVWHGTPGFQYADWPSHAPVDTGVRLPFGEGDLLIMPETGGSKWSFLAQGHPVVVLCQGIDFVFADADFQTDVLGDYPGWPNARAALAVSKTIGTFLKRACTPGFPIHHVPVQLDTRFRPATKERVISLMPRRRKEDVLAAVQLVRRSGRLGDWRIEIIDGMTQDEVATALGRSAIFLFGAEREGFGLPGAEAMASGCYVIGFTGDGAKEYLTPDVASVIAESDVVEMADQILWAMAEFDASSPSLRARVEAGRAHVTARYSAAVVRSALDTALRELTAPGSPALIERPVVLPHYQAFGPRWGKAGALYTRGRRTARALADRVLERRG